MNAAEHNARLAMDAIVNAGIPGRGPMGVRQNRLNTAILAVDFFTIAELYEWLPFFGSDRRPTADFTEDGNRTVLVCVDWRGWRVQLYADEPADLPAPATAAHDGLFGAAANRATAAANRAATDQAQEARMDELATLLNAETADEIPPHPDTAVPAGDVPHLDDDGSCICVCRRCERPEGGCICRDCNGKCGGHVPTADEIAGGE
jgi:hypothetical protein